MQAMMPKTLTEYFAVAVGLATFVAWLCCWLQA